MSLFKHRYINHVSKVRLPKNNKTKSFKPINKITQKSSKNLDDVITARYYFISVAIILSFIIILIRLTKLQVVDYDKYVAYLETATEKTVEGSSSPRGRIYDRNYKLLVDNEAIKTIYYKKEPGVTNKEEIDLAYKIGSLIDVNYDKLSDYRLKYFYYVNNYDECLKKITKDEYRQYRERKLKNTDLEKLIFERITEEELSIYKEDDLEAAYIYYLMNKGYSYAEKVIKNKDVTEKEYATISENIDSLHGVNTKLDWDRIYLYGDVFKSILGSVSSSSSGIPSEVLNSYLEKGYSMDDRVGTSYLELQYEDYLKGTKPIYRIVNNNYELIHQGKRGNDIVLTIDIDLQKYLEETLKNEVLNAKGEPNTKHYDRSFVVISNPNTGEILAMAGKQARYYNGKFIAVDYTPGVVTLPVTPGSIVKGASMMVGYKYGAIDIGSVILDECLKIQSTPLKCSWRTMGYVDDLYALRYSSNVYQYKTAIRVAGGNYQYDKPLKINTDAFNKYRDMYAQFGLGVKTGIDLPVESLGYRGTSKLPGHLLDFAIGQYDTYTPIQLSQYINTIANGGTRYRPYLLKEVYSPSTNSDNVFGDLIYAAEKDALSTVDIPKKYMDRVRLGFHQVMTNGIGYGYMGSYYNSSGKTGTSESFIDTNGDGKVDTETISTSFIGYAPSDNPIMSIVVVSPDISIPNANYQSMITQRLSSKMVNYFFYSRK